MVAMTTWLQHTPLGITVSVWGLCGLVWAAYAVVQAAGRYVDRRQKAAREARRDAFYVAAAQVYRDAYLAEMDKQRDLAAWDAEMREWVEGS